MKTNLNYDHMADKVKKVLHKDDIETDSIKRDFCFVYAEPCFHTKYRLVANILFLLTNTILDDNFKYKDVFGTNKSS